jgi:hypothetical protein
MPPKMPRRPPAEIAESLRSALAVGERFLLGMAEQDGW